MGIGTTDDFSADELALIPQDDGTDTEQQATAATATDGGQQQTSGQPGSQIDDQGGQNQQTTTAPAAEQQPVNRQALRAARHGERTARQEADRLKRELEELRAKVPTTQTSSDDISDDEISALSEDVPVVGKLARKFRALEQQLTATQQRTAAPAAPEFTPPVLPAEVQDVVDAVPELLDWQHTPDQTLFQAAIGMDAYLQRLPAWANKPMSERFSEVVRRVKSEAAAQATTLQPNRTNPADAIAQAKRVMPQTLSDFGNGTSHTERPTLATFVTAKSDDDIMAMLDRMG
jgi:hypothetical protein